MRLDLINLYNSLFGYVGAPYSSLNTKYKVESQEGWDADLANNSPEPLAIAANGSPIHLPCDLGDYTLPNEPLISIAQTKHIITTKLDGVDGTFKELYSQGDWLVTIKGICIDEDNPDSYPEDQVRQIRNICEERKHVAITNRLTALFNIEHLAIERFEFPAVPGQLGMQGYVIRAKSDREFMLELKEK